MIGLERYLRGCGLEQGLLHLVKLRASQVNGCAYCIDTHWKDLEALAEDEQRLYSLDAWRECPWYTVRERAALAWTEAVATINAWNRLAISARTEPGTYRPRGDASAGVES
jgi:AhpD family alkylhydroperoxidase